MAFPSIAPPTKINIEPSFNTISAEFDGGYEATRERNTRDRKMFKIDFSLLTRADKDLLISHFNTVRGSVPFDWTNIDDNVTYSVRYSKAPSTPTMASTPDRFNISIEVKEV